MIIFLSCVFLLGFSTVKATDIIGHSDSVEDFKKYPYNCSPVLLLKEKTVSNPVVLHEDEWGDILVGSHYSEKLDLYLKENNSFKSAKYLLKSAWSGDDDALNYLDTLLENSNLNKSVLDSYNEKDEESFKGYFSLVKEKLENDQ
mgnify:CR=1 FL=1